MRKFNTFTKTALLSIATLTIIAHTAPNYGAQALSKNLNRFINRTEQELDPIISKVESGTSGLICGVAGCLALYTGLNAINHLIQRQNTTDNTGAVTASWFTKSLKNVALACVFGAMCYKFGQNVPEVRDFISALRS